MNRSRRDRLAAPVLALTAVLSTASISTASAEPAGESPVGQSRGQRVYVSAYSHLFKLEKRGRVNLSATLSVRNTDMVNTIVVKVADYYDSEGKRTQSLVKSPVSIGPLGTRSYLISQSDDSGGSGANFIVEWEAQSPVTAPMVESIMVGTQGTHSFSFKGRAQVVSELGL